MNFIQFLKLATGIAVLHHSWWFPALTERRAWRSTFLHWSELKGLYHRGFEVFLRIESLKQEHGKWFWCSHDEHGAMSGFIVGKIPFDVVKAVEWGGDQYYHCRVFQTKKAAV